MLKIGISACCMPPDPNRGVFRAKTLLYLEQSMAHWIQGPASLPFKAMPWLIPTRPNSPDSPDSKDRRSTIQLQDYIAELDGLVLHGGSDISPLTYGEEPLKPEWGGDARRDAYEIELFHEFLRAGKPILGICRGAQLMNVALGGTLYQDIPTQLKTACKHRDPDLPGTPNLYDLNCHAVHFESGSKLFEIYENLNRTSSEKPTDFTQPQQVTSIHHQGIRSLGRDLKVEAKSDPDGMIEAIRMSSQDFVIGVQWHPEFHDPKRQGEGILSNGPLLRAFLEAAEKRKLNASSKLIYPSETSK